MKNIMKRIVFTLVTISLVGLGCVPSSWAVTDDQFLALQKQVQDQNQQLQALEKEHQDDQAEIQSLKDQQGQTEQKTEEIKKTADKAVEVASQVQPVVQPVSAEVKVPVENHNFVLAGDAEVQYTDQGGGNKAHGSYGLADFAPVFLFRANDKVLFEAGFDTTIDNNSFDTTNSPNPGANIGASGGNQGYSTTFNLTFATIDYMFNDYATLIAGEMLLPLGTYSERGAGWLNKFADDPMSRSLLIGTGVGAQVRGSKAIGENGSMLTYAVYTANGGHSIDNTPFATTIDNSGGNTIQNFDPSGNRTNLNRTPSEGGRIGWFYPFKPHYDVELGLSGQTGEWDSSGKLWQAGVIDGALHLSPYFETKGEYIYTREQTADLGTIAPQGWWLQSGFKMSFFNWDVPMIPNTELVFRYDTENYAIGNLTSTAKSSRTFEPGLVYYITNSLWLKGSYEKTFHSDGVPSDNEWILQLSYGF